MSKITQHCATMDEIVNGKMDCPLPVALIPNNMGINLCSVRSVSWTKIDEQLINLTINFEPALESLEEVAELTTEQLLTHRIPIVRLIAAQALKGQK